MAILGADCTIQKAATDDVQSVSVMVGELLAEIMLSIGVAAFNFNLEATMSRLKEFLDNGKYFVFVAQDRSGKLVGFVSLYESHALYAEGAFGTIAELYVRPDCRSMRIGLELLSMAKSFGASRSWKRLEVTTPPLPQFDKTAKFYVREGFAITGGRKLKITL